MSTVFTQLGQRILLTSIVGIVLFFVGVQAVFAQANPQINYQGKLTDGSGIAVPDGTYNMNFWLVASGTAPTSTAVWSESLTGTDRVQVTNGLFSVMLGSSTPLTGVDFNQTLYLGVEIGGTSTPAWDGEMSPRKVLGTVPAAFVANWSAAAGAASSSDEALLLGGVASSSFLRSDEADTMEATSTGSLLTLIQNGAGAVARFFSGVTEVFTILNNGNVGVGTSTPGERLTVAGDVRVTGTSTLATTTISQLNLGTALSAVNGGIGLSSVTQNQLLIGGAGNTWSQIATSSLGLGNNTFLGLSDTPSSYTANRILFTNSGASAVTDSASFVFDGTNLGIGSTTPSARLTVQGAAGTANIATFASSTGSTTLALLANGNLELPGQLISAGIEWTTRSAAGNDDSWQSVAYGNGRFVVVGSGSDYVMYSGDGVNWATTTAGESHAWLSVTYGNGLFVAVSNTGTYRVMTSPDGITWTPRTAAAANNWLTVTYGNGRFVAMSNSGTNRAMYSYDGINWSSGSGLTTGAWYSVTYGNNTYVAVGCQNTIPTCIGAPGLATSSDGITWTTASNMPVSGYWNEVTYGNGRFVAVSKNISQGFGTITYSQDGTTWSNTSFNGDWSSVEYGNGIFVATDDTSSVFASSPDGINWTRRQLPQSGIWNSITYGNGRFVAVGSSGTNRVMTSGFPEKTELAHNNIYQGGTSFFGGLRAGTTTSSIASVFLQSEAGKNPFAIASSTGTQLLTLDQRGYLGLGSSTPSELLTVAGNTYISGNLSALGVTTLANASTTALTLGGALYDTTNSAGTAGMVLQTTGTSTQWVATSSLGISSGASTFLALTDTPSSYTANRILFTNSGANAVTDSANFTFDGSQLSVNGDVRSGYFTATSTTGTSTFAGAVGIGTTSPARTLTVGGDVYFAGNSTTTGSAVIGTEKIGASNNSLAVGYVDGLGQGINASNRSLAGGLVSGLGQGIYASGAGSLAWGTAGISGSEIRASGQGSIALGSGGVIASGTGSFAIGYGDSNFGGYIVSGGNGSFAGGYAGNADVTASGNGSFAFGDSVSATNNFSTAFGRNFSNTLADTFQIGYSSTPIFTANASSIGIGTSTPGSRLTVAGDTYLGGSLSVSGAFKDSSNASGTAGYILQTTGSGTQWVATSSLGFTSGATTFTALTDTPSSYTANRILFTNSGANAVTDSASFVFDGTNLGIGSTTPSARLTVQGAAGTANIATFASSTGSTTLALLANGNLELGGQLISAGVEWTERSATEANSWTSITYGNGRFVAIAFDGTNRIMTSDDGVSWTAVAAPDQRVWQSVTYGNGLFVAVCSYTDAYAACERTMYSKDGITWATSSPAASGNWYSVTYGNGKFVAVGQSGSSRVMTSSDGINWSLQTAAELNYWYSVTYGNGKFVAVGSLNSGSNVVMTSPDGITWTAQSAAGDDDSWVSVTYGNGLFVAVADSGTDNRVMTSPDGITWTAQSAAGDDDSWVSVTYGNGLFVAVGTGDDYVMTSPDGINWTLRNVVDNGWRAVTYGNGRFVAIAWTGTNRVITSGVTEKTELAHNNIYQGETSFMTQVSIGTTTKNALLTVAGNTYIGGNLTALGVTTLANASTTALTLGGTLYDTTNSAGTAGMVLQTTGTSTQWVATSSLGFTSGATTFTALTDTPSSYTANRILFTNSGANAVTDSASFVFDGTNLGIGSTTPSARLTVQGAAGTANIATFASSTGSALLSLTSGGRLVFGTTTSANILINGGATSTDPSLGARNIAIGPRAFSYYGTNAVDNIAFGYQALMGSSTVPSSGTDNFAAGFQAMQNNTSGYYNTAIGYRALMNNTSGVSNFAVGSQALSNSRTASNNIAIGDQALSANTTGFSNIAMGLYTLGLNSTGIDNIGMGREVLYFNDTGSSNIALGKYAMQFNDTGSYNIAFGQDTLQNVDSGSYNSALGFNALKNYNGTGTIGIGYQAGNSLTNGDRNIIIGYDVDFDNASTSLGLNIGNIIYGNNIDGTGTTVSTGNIGIGTSTPGSRLTVAGDTYLGGSLSVSGAFKDSSNASGTAGYILQTTGSGTQWVATSSLGFTSGATTFTALTDTPSSYTANRILFTNSGASAVTDSANFTFDGSQLSVNGDVRSGYFTATSTTGTSTFAGRVGIGTTTPGALLSLMGTAGQTSPLFTISSSTGVSLLSLSADGSFDLDGGGIYYDASTRQTSIESLNLGAINFADDAGAVSWVDMGVVSAATGTVMSYTAQLDANPILTIYGESAGSGNVQNLRVGIGSTTPSARLTVVGAAGSDNLFTFASSTGSALLSLTSNGRLVFGSTTNADIFVNGGSTTASPQLNGDNVVIGNNAFQYASSTSLAQYNIALGTQALRGSTSVAMTGDHNFAAGYYALQWNTTGSRNAAIGEGALGVNLSGSHNTAIGYNALNSNVTGWNNIALGETALYSNATGYYNIALGKEAMITNVSGFDNIALGRTSLSANTSGSDNISLGRDSMSLNTSGSYNVAQGYYSLGANTTGSYNNALGYGAIYNYNGTGTIGIGYQAGGALTSGDRNIIIGYDVNFDNASTSLGLNIGNIIYGNNVDGTGTTVSSGNIGIGTSTPGSKLTVAGDINLTGALRTNGNAGTNGYILQTTGSGTQWVATSSLGFTSGATTFTALTDTPSSYTANRILFTNSGANAVTDSASFVFDGTNLGIGSTTPSARLTVQGAAGTANIATFASSTGSTTLALLANGNLELPGQLISAGIEWIGRSAAGNNDSWQDVAYGNGIFVAVSDSGDRVMYSSDGINWSTTTIAGNNDNWYSVTYGNGLFVAVAYLGDDRFATSPDGINWTTRSVAGDDDWWSSVKYAQNKFVAVARCGTNGGDCVATSLDGIEWTVQSAPSAYDWEDLAYGNGLFVAVPSGDDQWNGTSTVMTSPDGVNWTSRTAISSNWYAITYGNGLFVAVGFNGSVMTSPDGVNWTSRTAISSNWYAVTYGNGLFVAITDGSTNGGVMTSPDGVNWTERKSAENNAWKSVTYGNGIFVTVGVVDSGANVVMTSGKTYTSQLAHNNIYQGGTSFFGGLRAGTTTSSIASIFLQSEAGKNPFAVASSSGTQLLTLTQTGALGLGTSTPFGAGLTIERTGLSGTTTAGIGQYLTFSNSVAAAQQFGNNTYIRTTNTATTTLLGNFLRIEDSTVLGNTVRGFEVQSDWGTNTLGENTALSGYARTFGVRGITSGDAGGSYEPAGVYGETTGTTQGNALRGYSSTITTAALLKLFQDSSAFTGTGLLMNFGNAGGSFSSTTASKFIDLKNAGTSMFTVGAYGMLTIGDGSTTTNAGIQIGYGGICVDNDGSCTASTTGRITAVQYGTANSDLAENYFTNEAVGPGEVVFLKGGLSVGRATKAEANKVIGVISTAPGLVMGDNDSSLNAGERAVPVGLSGRVPVRVSNENGEVKAGDELMLSSIPGVVMKASSTGYIIGRALEDYDSSRAYSDTYINQFGENIIVPEYTPINRESDPRIDDGCYYGGGNRTDEEVCVPLTATTSDAQYDEADRLAAEEAKARALAALALVDSEEIVVDEDTTVEVGQIVMFIDLRYRYLDEDGLAMMAALMATTTEVVEGEEVVGTLWQRLVTLAENFVDGVLSVFTLKADRVETNQLCVDGVCVNANDLRHLLNSANEQPTNPTEPEPTPEPVLDEPIPEPVPEIDTGTTTTPDVATTTATSTDEGAEPTIEEEVLPEQETSVSEEVVEEPEPTPSVPEETITTPPAAEESEPVSEANSSGLPETDIPL